MGATPSIRAARVSKWYGRVTALQAVSLELEPGVWGLLGPNGSGKSTFLHLAAGQLRPSLGELRVCGEAPFGNPAVLSKIGFCPEADALYEELTAHQFVTAMARLTGYAKSEAEARAEAVLTRLDLRGAMHRAMGGYSRGMRQRAKLAQTLVHEPTVLLLDEPLTGTDPISRQVILEEVRRRAEAGALVLFSTHVLPEVETLTDRVLLLVRGQVVAQGKTGEIRRMMEDRPHHIRVTTPRGRDLGTALAKSASIAAVFFDDAGVTFATHDPGTAYDAIRDAAVTLDLEISSLTSPDATLDALFHQLVEYASRGAGTGADASVGRHGAAVPPPSGIASPPSPGVTP